MNTQTILVVDDHPFPRQGIATFLRQNGYMVVEAADEQTGYALAEAHKPHGAVVDIIIPAAPVSHPLSYPPAMAENGLRLGSRLKQQDPALGLVFLSSYSDYGGDILNLMREYRLGVAYKSKSASPAELLDALGRVLNGGVLIDFGILPPSYSLANELYATLTPAERPWVERALEALQAHRLTPREEETARWLARSRSLAGIAEALNISPKTVETYMTRLYAELGLDALKAHDPSLRPDLLLAKAYTLFDLQHGGRT